VKSVEGLAAYCKLLELRELVGKREMSDRVVHPVPQADCYLNR
jgi:hypothetical protein